jgi:adhesin/invasin
VYDASTLLADGRVLVTGGQTNAIVYSSAELYTPVLQGLVTSQTGVTFRAAPNSTPAAQIVQVLSPSASIPWTLSVKTYSGGSWLSATPSGATDAPTSAPTPVSITVNPSGLAAQDFYGAVTLTPTDGVHPPVSITVVLSIVSAGTAAPAQVSPTGLVFVATSGVTAKPQSFTISNITSTPLTFTATGASTPSWFTLTPKSGSITTALPATITVTPASASLSPGVYPGTITLAFSDSTTQTVTLLLVVSSSTPTSSVTTSVTTSASAHLRDFATAACTPTKLLPVLTSVGTGFSAPAGWPVAVIAQIVDDCGDLINTGSAVASFTNSDPPVSLIAIGGGTWSATWVPGPTYSGSSIRVDAQTPNPALAGSVQVSVAVAANPTVPVVTAGGIVSSGDYSSAPALGLLVSIFGSGLANASAQNSSLPLPTELSTTSVVLSGGAQLPLLYVSSTQINVLIPYEAVANATHQLVVQRNNAISVPVTTSVFNAAPAILSTAGNGLGQGHIYVIEPSGAETLADQNSPATAGNTVVIYCVGLGSVNPAVTSGGAAPGLPLAYANAAVTVTFGGQVATPGFAGLTPGFAGLYQVNVVVPTGVTPGNQVPVILSAGGKSSSGAIFMAIQ